MTEETPRRRGKRDIQPDMTPYDERSGISATDRLAAEKERRPSAVAKIARTLAGFAIFAVLVVGVFVVLGAVEDDTVPSANWSKPSAPVVSPEPLARQ